MEAVVKDAIAEGLLAAHKTLDRMRSSDELAVTMAAIAQRCIEAYRRQNKVLVAGNGGSAAHAQHIAGELVSRLAFDRAPLAAIALTVDTSVLTAIGNDYGYEVIFERQIAGLGREQDVFIALSTSGRSRNILRALTEARRRRLVCIGFTGSGGGDMPQLCDLCLEIPAEDTPSIQEGHILCAHIICGLVERALFALPAPRGG
jgi:D-sedoheptulose 7-phosphate isomerase